VAGLLEPEQNLVISRELMLQAFLPLVRETFDLCDRSVKMVNADNSKVDVLNLCAAGL